MVHISRELTAIALFVGPLIGTGSPAVLRRVRAMDWQRDTLACEAATIATEALFGVSSIKSFRQEALFASRYTDKLNETYAVAMRAQVFREVWKGGVLVVAAAAIGIALYRGGMAVLNGALAPGQRGRVELAL